MLPYSVAISVVIFHCLPHHVLSIFFFFNDTATTEIYTLSLHDALPIAGATDVVGGTFTPHCAAIHPARLRSEEHTSELQSRGHLVCRLLLEKKKKEPCMALPHLRLSTHVPTGRRAPFYAQVLPPR